MNRNMLFKGWALILMFAMLFSGCNKEEVDSPQNLAELSFDEQAIMDRLPEGLLASNDPKAQECVDMIEEALDMSEFRTNLVVPDYATPSAKKASGDTWSWTFTYMGGIWTFYWTYDEDATKHYWTMEIQFGDGERYDYITAWENKDGSGGEVVYSFNWVLIYEGDYDEYKDLHWTYTWSLDSSDAYHFTWTWDADTSSEFYYLYNYQVVIYADGSGELDYYYFDALFYHMEWDANGNGSWQYYFGGQEQSGTWTAA